MKIVAVLLFLCLNVHADTAERAQNAAIADVATTGIGLALGAAEANPIGLATIPLKLVILDYAESLQDGEKQELQSAIASIWGGASANNLCVIAAIATGGTFAPACVLLGLVYGLTQWETSANERLFWKACQLEKERQNNPALKCIYKKG